MVDHRTHLSSLSLLFAFLLFHQPPSHSHFQLSFIPLLANAYLHLSTLSFTWSLSRYRDHLQTLSCLTSENKNGLRVDLSHMGGPCCGNAQKNMSHPKTYLKTASTEKGIIHLRGRNHFAPVLNWGILSIHVP